MEQEVKEVVYLAVAAMLLSIILGMASYAIHLNNDMAEVRNGQIVAHQTIQQYNKYNKYNKNTIIGDEVIECLRLYYDSGIDIFVDSRENVESGSVVNSLTQCGRSGCTDHRIYNTHQFIIHKGTSDDYFKVSESMFDRPKDDMRNWFPTESKYRCYLVYNSQDVTQFYDNLMEKFNTHPSMVTGDAATELLDSFIGYPAAGSEVTGIVIINTNSYGGN